MELTNSLWKQEQLVKANNVFFFMKLLESRFTETLLMGQHDELGFLIGDQVF